MSELPSLVRDLALILLLASAATLLCRKLRQPLVLGYILAGFLAGPVVNFLPTVADRESIELWSELGVIFLMFSVGLEFSIHKLAQVGLAGILAALFEVCGMMVVGVLLGQALGWSGMDSVFLGGMIGISSTMVALKAMEDAKIKESKFAGYAIGTLICEDIVAVFLMVILTTVSVSQGISGQELLLTVGKLLFYLTCWLLAGIFCLPTLLNKVQKLVNDEMLLLIALAICFGMVWIADALGFSSALGAFLAGSILAGTLHVEKIERLVVPCKYLFGAVFFVSVGLLVSPATIADYALPILLICLAILSCKVILLILGMMAAGKGIEPSVRAACCLTQIGEFSFIIAGLGNSLGVTSDFLYPVIVAVSVITSFTTPLMIKSAEGLARRITALMPERLRQGWEKYGNNDDDSALQDSDWLGFGKGYAATLLLHSLISLGIIMLVPVLCRPLLGDWPWAPLLICAITELCIMPFVSQLLIYRNSYMTSLWLRGIKNRLPLLVLMGVRVLAAMSLLIIPLYLVLRFHPVLITLAGLLLTLLLVCNKGFRGLYLKIEARFLANFNERKLHEEYGSSAQGEFGRRLNEELLVQRFDCPKDSEVLDKTLAELAWGRVYGLKVIKIVRGRRHINIPDGSQRLLPDDRVLLLGEAKDLENFVYSCGGRRLLVPEPEPACTLKDYIAHQGSVLQGEQQLYCCAVHLSEAPLYVGKNLRDSTLREDWDCFLLGLERDMLPIMNPSPDIVLESRDWVWVLGGKKMGERLVAEGLV